MRAPPRVIALDRPLLLAADVNDYVTRLGYHDREVEEELAMIEATRKSTARVLRSAPAEAWQRVGIHSYKGLQTLEQVVTAITNHIPHHLGFVAEKRKALGVYCAGSAPTRRFSLIPAGWGTPIPEPFPFSRKN